MPKPKTKDLARRGTETTTQRVKMQMREAAGRDVSPESYGGDIIEDSAQYVADRAADGIREMGSSVKDKAADQIKERIDRVRQREDVPDSDQSSPQEPQSGRSYSEPRTDPHTGPQDRPVDASPNSAPDRSPRQRPEGAERIKTKDSYIHSQGEAPTPREPQKRAIQVERTAAHKKGKIPDTPAKKTGRPKAVQLYQSLCPRRKASRTIRIQDGAAGWEANHQNSREKRRKNNAQRGSQNCAKGRGQDIPRCRENRKQEREGGGTDSPGDGKGNPAGSTGCRQDGPGSGPRSTGCSESCGGSGQGRCKSCRRIEQGIDHGDHIVPVAVVIILAVALVAVILCACFGVFASNETEDGNPMTAAILEIDTEFRAGIDAEIARLSTGDYDEIVVRYAGDMDGDSDYLINWNDVIAVYAVRVTMDKENPMDVLEVTPEKIEKLRETFLAMNTVEYDTEVIETEGAGAQVGDADEEEAEPYRKLIITVSVNSMDHLAGADLYSFTDDQREALAAMMDPQMLPMYAELTGVDLLGGFEGSITDIVSGLPIGEKGTEIVTAALTRLGHPYSQDYRGEGNYVDCSSLAQWAYRQAGISIPGTSVAQAQYCANNGLNIGHSELAPGDLVFWSKTTCDCGRYAEIHHVGIYIGDNRVIEASSSKGCVIVRELWGLGVKMAGAFLWAGLLTFTLRNQGDNNPQRSSWSFPLP